MAFCGKDKLVNRALALLRKMAWCALQILFVGLMDLNFASSIIFVAKAILRASPFGVFKGPP
jgi:hypothetical protein